LASAGSSRMTMVLTTGKIWSPGMPTRLACSRSIQDPAPGRCRRSRTGRPRTLGCHARCWRSLRRPRRHAADAVSRQMADADRVGASQRRQHQYCDRCRRNRLRIGAASAVRSRRWWGCHPRPGVAASAMRGRAEPRRRQSCRREARPAETARARCGLDGGSALCDQHLPGRHGNAG